MVDAEGKFDQAGPVYGSDRVSAFQGVEESRVRHFLGRFTAFAGPAGLVNRPSAFTVPSHFLSTQYLQADIERKLPLLGGCSFEHSFSF